jgi:hypothetical protein
MKFTLYFSADETWYDIHWAKNEILREKLIDLDKDSKLFWNDIIEVFDQEGRLKGNYQLVNCSYSMHANLIAEMLSKKCT